MDLFSDILSRLFSLSTNLCSSALFLLFIVAFLSSREYANTCTNVIVFGLTWPEIDFTMYPHEASTITITTSDVCSTCCRENIYTYKMGNIMANSYIGGGNMCNCHKSLTNFIPQGCIKNQTYFKLTVGDGKWNHSLCGDWHIVVNPRLQWRVSVTDVVYVIPDFSEMKNNKQIHIYLSVRAPSSEEWNYLKHHLHRY